MAFLFSTQPSRQSGFTFIELLIVITIIAVLISGAAFGYLEMIKKGRIARAQGDVSAISKGILQLSLDTGEYPSHFTVTDCYLQGAVTNHIELDNSGATGLFATDGLFTGWKGPYIENVPNDPWGNNYILDQDYECNISNKGCNDYANLANVSGNFNALAVFSRGPNESDVYTYDDDNIVAVLCAEAE